MKKKMLGFFFNLQYTAIFFFFFKSGMPFPGVSLLYHSNWVAHKLLCICLALPRHSCPLLQCHTITAHCCCATLRDAMTQGNNIQDKYITLSNIFWNRLYYNFKLLQSIFFFASTTPFWQRLQRSFRNTHFFGQKWSHSETLWQNEPH